MSRLKHIPGDKPSHFIRQWREYRGLTQERLAERVELSKGAISNIENGKSGYTEPLLKALAYALMCEPADLIMRNPLKEEAIWSIWDKVPASERGKALSVLKAFIPQEDERKYG